MKIRILSYLLLLLLATGCSPKITVTSEPSPDFHLAGYQTFAFYDVEASGSGLSDNYKPKIDLLKEEIARQLQARGLRQVSESPDLLVNIGVVVEEEVQTRQTDFRTDAPIYIGQRHYTWESKEVPVRHYKTGAVSVDFINNSRNELVWQGTAEGILPDNGRKLREQVQQGIKELVSHVPQ